MASTAAFNSIKQQGNGSTTSIVAHECICQKIREGVSGHASSTFRLANRWNPEHTEAQEIGNHTATTTNKRTHRLKLAHHATQLAKRPRYDHLIHWLGKPQPNNHN